MAPPHPVNLFDADDRFFACQKKMESVGQVMHRISSVRYPGVEDLVSQHIVLRTLTMELANKFKRASTSKSPSQKQLRSKDLKAIRSLELLVEEFASILEEARQDIEAA